MAGEVLIIVGAGPGISLATARRFGSEGFTVALIGRREQVLQNCHDQLGSAGIRSIYRVADCAREPDLNTALLKIQAEVGAADALLYNAAHIKWKNLLDETAADVMATTCRDHSSEYKYKDPDLVEQLQGSAAVLLGPAA